MSTHRVKSSSGCVDPHARPENWLPGGELCFWRNPDGTPKQGYTAKGIAHLDELALRDYNESKRLKQ